MSSTSGVAAHAGSRGGGGGVMVDHLGSLYLTHALLQPLAVPSADPGRWEPAAAVSPA